MPVRLTEELAMIDMICKGRLVSGFVHGGGQEQLAAGAIRKATIIGGRGTAIGISL